MHECNSQIQESSNSQASYIFCYSIYKFIPASDKNLIVFHMIHSYF